MLRMSKMTDYGIVVLARLAGGGSAATQTARELALQTHVPLPSVSKVLKELSHHGFLVSHRGVSGGYSLARPANEITVADVVSALEGPVSLTECGAHSTGASACGLEGTCQVRPHMRLINGVIGDALRRLTLADLSGPAHHAPARLSPSSARTSAAP
jgi:FeS assembly SUF system regulator